MKVKDRKRLNGGLFGEWVRRPCLFAAGPRITEASPRQLVMAALQLPEYRRGLPIQASERAGQ